MFFHLHVCLHLRTLTFKTWGGKGLADKIMEDEKNEFFLSQGQVEG